MLGRGLHAFVEFSHVSQLGQTVTISLPILACGLDWVTQASDPLRNIPDCDDANSSTECFSHDVGSKRGMLRPAADEEKKDPLVAEEARTRI